jgi:hypothetical protein
MKTALEALFGAMVAGGWATVSDGDVESPTGHFARVHNATDELGEIRDAFADTIEMYGDPGDDKIVGDFIVIEDSRGFVHITRYDNASDTIDAYDALQDQYGAWYDAQPLQDA